MKLDLQIGETIKTEEVGIARITDVAQSTFKKTLLLELTDCQGATFWFLQENINLIEDES